jgi:lipopolysaccharide transport system ATP-binding protein
VLLLDTKFLGQNLASIPPGEGQIRITLPKLSLLPGKYHFAIWAAANRVIADWIKNAGTFDVEGGDYFGTGQLPPQREALFVTPHAFLYEPTASANKAVELAGVP